MVVYSNVTLVLVHSIIFRTCVVNVLGEPTELYNNVYKSDIKV